MKSVKSLVFILITGILLISCSLEPDHSIRIKNEYFETINNVMIGVVSYGTIASGITSEYKPVDEGSHTLSGTTTSGQPLTGSVTISGKGKHKWTMTILPSGTVEIKED